MLQKGEQYYQKMTKKELEYWGLLYELYKYRYRYIKYKIN